MSWAVTSTGRAAAVAKNVAAQIAASKCSEPEQTIKAKVGEALAMALGAMDPATPVSIDASGSQSTAPSGKTVNQLSIKLQPIWSFLENEAADEAPKA